METNKEVMVWMYRGETFPDKYTLVKKYGFSTCKFQNKIKDGKIIKIN